MQKMMSKSARLPLNPVLGAFAETSAAVSLSLQTSKRELKQRIKELQWLQKHMFKVSETNIDLKYPSEESKELKGEELWKCLDRNFQQTLPFVE
jgi:hypothetical protein